MENNNKKENTIAIRQTKEKEAVFEALKEIPIVQMACKKAGIGRATYYRWLKEDRNFQKQVDNAMNRGFEYINDMGEAQVIILIKEKKLPAIALWLKHHHPHYGAKVEIERKGNIQEPLSAKQEEIVRKALQAVKPKKAYEKGK